VRLALPERATYWSERATLIGERILTEAWNEERQTYAESFGGRDLDASVLLMVEVGLIAPTDPRFIATVDALEKHLCDGPYMRRYEAPDDFGRPETAFNICTFWRIDALARIGRKEQAREIFQAMLDARNHLGLLSEDTHPVTGKMWGNFPRNLFDGRHHQLRHAAVGLMGERYLIVLPALFCMLILITKNNKGVCLCRAWLWYRTVWLIRASPPPAVLQ